MTQDAELKVGLYSQLSYGWGADSISGWDFESGWDVFGSTINGATSFTSNLAGGNIVKAADVFVSGQTYRIIFSGSATSGDIRLEILETSTVIGTNSGTYTFVSDGTQLKIVGVTDGTTVTVNTLEISLADRTFNTNIGGRIYFEQAPDKPTFPYCVYSFFTDTNSFDSGNQWEETFIQISLFDDTKDDGVIIDGLTSDLIDLFYGSTLSFTNYTQISFERIAKRNLYSEEKIWHKVIEYRIEIEHN